MAGGELPSARLVSQRLAEVASDDIRDKEDNNNNNNNNNNNKSELTLAVMLWGQLLAHDLGHTPEQVRSLFSIPCQLWLALYIALCSSV